MAVYTVYFTTLEELVVAVWDPTDTGPQPRGKQVLTPSGASIPPGIRASFYRHTINSLRSGRPGGHFGRPRRPRCEAKRANPWGGSANHLRAKQNHARLTDRLDRSPDSTHSTYRRTSRQPTPTHCLACHITHIR